MGHQISWDNDEKTVVLQQYVTPATKDDLYYLAQKSSEMLKTVSHTVHLIIDEREIDLIVTSADMNYLEKLTPPNQGAVIMVVKESVLPYKRMMQSIGKSVAPHAFDRPFFAPSIDEARALLMEHFQVNYASVKG